MRRATTALLALVVLALALAPAAARAATTYYARGGATGTTCARGDECEIARAVELATGGDSIALLPGPTFTPATEIEVTLPVEIGGVPGAARPTISGATGNVGMFLEGGARLHDVNVVGNGNFAISIPSGSAERVFAETSDSSAAACAVGNATIVDSVCHSAEGTAILMPGPVPGSLTTHLHNVTAVGSADGIKVEESGSAATENLIEAVNVIAIGGPLGSAVAAKSSMSSGTSIVRLSHSDYARTNPSGPRSAITPLATNGNFPTQPQFVNQAAGDFHQLFSSRTIDSGFAEAANGELDLDGNPRTLDGRPVCGGANVGVTDIGAYEYVPAPLRCPAPAPVPGSSVSPLPPRPGTKLGKAKIDSGAGTAKFTFSGSGSVTGFACELVRPHRKGTKAKRPKFGGCRSPKTYRHLADGRYTFKVIAHGLGGADATPALRRFRIG